MTIAHGLWTVALLVFILAFSSSAIGMPTVVYDNTTNFVSGEYATDGFWPFSQYAPPDGVEGTGDQIILSGTCRTIVEFDLILSSSEPTILSSLTLAFHPVGTGGYPADPIWTNTITDVAVNGITPVVFGVPDVVVPDEFAWVAIADSMSAGLATCDPPTIGASADFFWDYDISGETWYPMYFEGNPVANFGAKVLAVPEPSSMTLFFLGGLLAHWRRRPC